MKRRRFQGQVTAAPLLESSLATIGAITGNGFLSSKSRAPESAIQLALSRPSALARSGVSRSSAGLADPEPTLRITIDIHARRARSRGPAAEVRPVLRDRHLGTDALSRWSEGEKRRLRRGPQLHGRCIRDRDHQDQKGERTRTTRYSTHFPPPSSREPWLTSAELRRQRQ